MGASFWLPLESYTGMLSPLLWTTPNLGCTLSKDVSQIIGAICLTIGGFDQVDWFGFTWRTTNWYAPVEDMCIPEAKEIGLNRDGFSLVNCLDSLDVP